MGGCYNWSMAEITRAISWEAPEHYRQEKGSDWYWALGIIALCGAVAAFVFGNFLFAILILVASAAMVLQSAKQPRVIPFMVGTRGVRVGEKLYPYSTFDAYCIDEEDNRGPQLLLRFKNAFLPLVVMAIPSDNVETIEELVRERLPETELEEPIAHRILELLGF